MNTLQKSRITGLLAIPAGKPLPKEAAAELMVVVYDQLRKLARGMLRHERSGHTLQPTALVHEVYLKMVDQNRVEWQGKTHFFAVGAQMMRRLLVDHARQHGRQKRGGEWQRVTLSGVSLGLLDHPLEPEEMLSLDDALTRLAAIDSRQAQVVEMKFFAGLSVDEIAAVLGVSKRTVEGEWAHSRAWLRRELGGTAARR